MPHKSAKQKLSGVSRILFPITGLAALIWFLVRVIPKPSRALYPCQRVATPIASGFAVWLFGSIAGIVPWVYGYRSAKQLHKKSKLKAALVLTAAAISLCYTIAFVGTQPNVAQDEPFIPEASNMPMGTGIGINPGRVVWAYDPDATNENLEGNWFDDANTNPDAVERMMIESLLRLTGERTVANAWNAVFTYHNLRHNRGTDGYNRGQKIAVKINMNNSDSGEWTESTYNTSPQTINAVVRQLINNVGVRGADITLYDASRGIGDPVIQAVRSNPGGEYRNVRFVVSPARMGPGRIPAKYDTAHPVCFADTAMQDYSTTYLPTCVVEADYQINMGIMKGHNLCGVTLCAKNFLGSLYRPANAVDGGNGWTPNGTDEKNRGLHGFINPFYYSAWKLQGRPAESYNALVDLMGHKHLGGKVVLHIVDGLYSAKVQNAVRSGLSIIKWKSAPFNNDWPSSIFMSQDGVAIESVCIDFMRNEPEMEWMRGTLDNYLHEAALADNPPSGTFYDPEGDGIRLRSLGVHEHWNNPVDRRYTGNNKSGMGIELVSFMPE